MSDMPAFPATKVPLLSAEKIQKIFGVRKNIPPSNLRTLSERVNSAGKK